MIWIRREPHAPPAGARVGGRPVYAVGDVHGCYDLLHALLGEIARDAAGGASGAGGGAPPLLVMLGDYVDRGPDTARVLAALAWLRRSGAVEARLLEGNHEAVLAMFIDDPAAHPRWLDWGGRETLASYGVAAPEQVDAAATLRALRDGLLDAMPVSHYRLLRELELSVRAGDYHFVHAGVRPGVPIAKQARDDLLWIREEFLEHERPAKSVVVHGHTWDGDRPTILPHRLGLDTGAYRTGVLTAARITDDAVEVIQAVRGA